MLLFFFTFSYKKQQHTELRTIRIPAYLLLPSKRNEIIFSRVHHRPLFPRTVASASVRCHLPRVFPHPVEKHTVPVGRVSCALGKQTGLTWSVKFTGTLSLRTATSWVMSDTAKLCKRYNRTVLRTCTIIHDSIAHCVEYLFP